MTKGLKNECLQLREELQNEYFRLDKNMRENMIGKHEDGSTRYANKPAHYIMQETFNNIRERLQQLDALLYPPHAAEEVLRKNRLTIEQQLKEIK
jgi:hypothetical protein